MHAVTAEFARNFTERGEIGASVSIWRHDEEVLSLHSGARTREEIATWNADTLVPVWSATKGPASLAMLLLLHERLTNSAEDELKIAALEQVKITRLRLEK